MWLKQRRERARSVQMSTFELEKQKIYIDRDAMGQMGIGLSELDRMVQLQPDRYVLSPHIKRQLVKLHPN